MVPKENDTNRRCGLVGVDVVLMEEVCHYRGGLQDLIYVQATSNETVYFLLPSEQDVASTMSLCIPPCPTRIIMD